jgi:HD-GYP domain-containing protein (c-di-GMP phosphodiesterase class II)
VALQQVKVNVSDLTLGMYVAELDRPWIETPFPLQGFYIARPQDIQALRNYCRHVMIDIERGYAPTSFEAPLAVTHDHPPPGRIKSRPLKKQPGRYREARTVEKEIPKAERVHQKLSASMDRLFADLRAGRSMDFAHTTKAVKSLVQSVIRNPNALVWLTRLQEHDNYSFNRSIRSAVWACVVGRHLGVAEDGLEALVLGVLLCDIGVTQLPIDLVTRPEPRIPEDQALFERHVEYGVQLLKRSAEIDKLVLTVVAAHHERFDGSGYPSGLSGDRIPYLGRIAGLVDYYEGLRNPRQRERALSSADAVSHLYQLRDTQFQGELVDEFIQAIGIYPAGTLVELSSSEVGIIVSQCYQRRLRPRLLVLCDADRTPLKRPRSLDLAGATRNRNGHAVEIVRSIDPGAMKVDLSQIHRASFGRRHLW